VKIGAIEPSTAYCLNALLGTMLKIHEMGDLEKRLARLESIATPPPAEPFVRGEEIRH
jgi:hypothetical protein